MIQTMNISALIRYLLLLIVTLICSMQIHASFAAEKKNRYKFENKFTDVLKLFKSTKSFMNFDCKANIKNYDGVHDQRYVVDLDICFNGRKYLTEFTLADRSEYIYDVLLGRQFLKKVAIIDPNSTFLTLATCELDSTNN